MDGTFSQATSSGVFPLLSRLLTVVEGERGQHQLNRCGQQCAMLFVRLYQQHQCLTL